MKRYSHARDQPICISTSLFDMEADDKLCLICSTPNNSIHFGVDVCRACSSFFKRAKLSGRKYPCRRGERDCKVTREDKFTCRRCRFDKCVAIGMVYDGPLRQNKQKIEADQEFCPDLPSTSSNTPCLDRIGREYEVSVANRQAKELAVLRSCGDAKRIPHPFYEVYTCPADVVKPTFHFTLDETWASFPKIFPRISQLSFVEQMELYRIYFPKFSIIDAYLRTLKVWGVFDKFSMFSVCIYIDIDDPNNWIPGEDGGCNRNALVDSTRLYVRDQMAVISPALLNARPTEEEVHALFALMLCDSEGNLDDSERLLSLLDSIREETLQDLQLYYREDLGLDDFSSRLGNLMTVCHAARECSSHFRSFFRMQVALFDLWTAETQLKELLL